MSNDANPLRALRIEKVTVNIGVGEAGEKLVKAMKVLEMVTGQKPVQTISKTVNRDLGIRVGMPLGCKVTLRGEIAEDFLKRALIIRENRVYSYSFDKEGNMSFGISDYTDFDGMKYDPEIGIFGMDVNVVVRRTGGTRVERRALQARRIPKEHRVLRDEAIEFMKSKYSVQVIE
ncbi:LSU ribosomal protein L5P [Thermoplasmatales archaeon BRNA1]|nr:LSU ribosomal protein L5P [Thermoplasmatales archaeon BRNA1]